METQSAVADLLPFDIDKLIVRIEKICGWTLPGKKPVHKEQSEYN
jgi:hypothetical protein